MTSKNSFTKMILQNIKGRSAWVLVSSLVFLLILPVRTLMQMDNVLSYMEKEPNLERELQFQFSRCIGYDNQMLYVVMIVAAFIMGMTGFWYLYSSEKTDFYHSLPISREKLFFVNYISGILIILVPYGLSTAIAYVVGYVRQAGYPGAAATAAGVFCTHTVFFLLFYHLAVLAVMLTGNLFTGTMGYLAFLVYGNMLVLGYRGLSERFFDTYYYNGFGSRMEMIIDGISPLAVYMKVLKFSESSRVQPMAVKSVLLCILAAAVVLFLGIFAYRKRFSESYHKSIAFGKMEPVIKAGVVLPVSVLTALIVSGGTGNYKFAWFAAVLAVSAVVLCIAMDFLYTLDLRECFRLRITNLLILAVLVILAVFYRFDLTGVDAYLPAKDKVESMSIYIDGINSLYDYSRYAPYRYEREYLEETEFQDFGDIYELARLGVETQKKYGGDPDTDDAENICWYRIKYHLRSGKEVYRSYCVLQDEEVLNLIGKVYDSWEFKEKTLPVEFVEEEKIAQLSVYDFYSFDRQLNLSQENMRKVFKTCKSEWESLTFQESREQRVIGYIDVICKGEDMADDGYALYTYEDYTHGLPIYEGFTKTKSLLKELGTPVYDSSYADEIERVEVNDLDSGKRHVFTEKEDIEEILKYAILESSNGEFGGISPDYSMNISVYWKDNIGCIDSSLFFSQDKIPECVKESISK